jgi:hypothetical protein
MSLGAGSFDPSRLLAPLRTYVSGADPVRAFGAAGARLLPGRFGRGPADGGDAERQGPPARGDMREPMQAKLPAWTPASWKI